MELPLSNRICSTFLVLVTVGFSVACAHAEPPGEVTADDGLGGVSSRLIVHSAATRPLTRLGSRCKSEPNGREASGAFPRD